MEETTAGTPTDDPEVLLNGRGRVAWRGLQVAVWLVGAAILLALVAAPEVGIHAFWNVLIPVAPALLVIAPGLWRNICPLGSTALFSRHVGVSRALRIPVRVQGWFALTGVVLLLVIVPLRHVALDLDGPATAAVIGGLAILAVMAGLTLEWRSGWCSGLCPVHPVEKLYGQKPGVIPPNAHCVKCERCVEPCADSTPGVHPLTASSTRARRVAGTLMVGGFAGFIWGWFHVPDYAFAEGWRHLDAAYGIPLAGTAVTLALFLVLKRTLPARHERRLVLAFATAAVGCYYWYRLPALFGFGVFAGDGMLVDASAALPEWAPWAMRAATTLFFIWWLMLRNGKKRAWSVRPHFAKPEPATVAAA